MLFNMNSESMIKSKKKKKKKKNPLDEILEDLECYGEGCEKEDLMSSGE